MQLKLGDRSLQAKKQAPVGAAGIIDAIAIGDEAAAQTTDMRNDGISIRVRYIFSGALCGRSTASVRSSKQATRT
jgi:hypothetical protein